MTTRTGGCACDAVRYEISAEPVFQVACHCRACQYASGGAPTLAMIVPKEALKVTKGEPRFYWSDRNQVIEVAASGIQQEWDSCPHINRWLFVSRRFDGRERSAVPTSCAQRPAVCLDAAARFALPVRKVCANSCFLVC